MNCRLALTLAGGCLFMALLAGPASAREIVLNQDTNIAIEAEGSMDNAGPALSDFLAKYLLRALHRERLDGKGGTVRFVLCSKAVRWQEMQWSKGLDVGQLDAFTLQADEAGPDTIRITGETVLATGFGVVEFLERYLDVIWAFPGELGICMPVRDEIRLNVATETVRPAFASRFHSGVRDYCPEYVKLMPTQGIVHEERGFFRADDCVRALRVRILTVANHNMIQIFPVKECKEKYPEVFPIKDGKPYVPPEPEECAAGNWSFQTWHPCYTNPKTIEVATQKAEAEFKSGAFCFSLGVNDGYKVQCQCPQCKALGFPNAYYHFVAAVANNLKSYYPPHMIGVLAYGDVAAPPTDIVLPDNVVVSVTGSDSAKGGGDDLLRWKQRARHTNAYEYLPGNGYWFPNFPFRIMQQNVKFFRDANAMGYWAMTYPMWPFDGPKMYINSHLLWNPDLDIDAALQRYCVAAFGPAGDPMARFYKRWAAIRDRDLIPGNVSTTWSYAESRHPYLQFARCTADDYQYTAACLEEAKKAADDPKARQRLEMVEAFFQYGKTLFDSLQARKEIFEFAEDKDWPKLASRALGLWTRRQELIPLFKAHPEWFLGTYCTLDWIMSKEWEEDERWAINYEAPNAIRTALFQAARHAPPEHVDTAGLAPEYAEVLKPCRTEPVSFTTITDKYGYFHRDLYHFMTSVPEGRGMRIKTASGISWKPAADAEYKDYWGNGMKRAAFSGYLPLKPGRQYLFQFDFAGRDGAVTLGVMSGNGGGKQTWMEDSFGPAPRSVTKRMLLKPDAFGENLEQWNVEIVFAPATERATFSGLCTVTQVGFDETGAAAAAPAGSAQDGPGVAPGELLAGGDFETAEIARGKLPVGWATYIGTPEPLEVVADSAPGSPGRRCLEIHPTTTAAPTISGIKSRLLPLDPSKPLTVSARSRRDGDKNAAPVNMAVAFYDAERKPIILPPGNHHVYLNLRVGPEWQSYSQTFSPPPAGAETFDRSSCFPPQTRFFEVWVLTQNCPVAAWFDDVSAMQPVSAGEAK